MHNMTYYSTRITTSEYECSLNYNSIHVKLSKVSNFNTHAVFVFVTDL